MFSIIENKYYQVFIQPYCIFILQELAGLGLLTCSCSSFGHFCGLFIILILILVLDSSNWCTCEGFRTWGGAQGSLCPQDPDPKSFHRTIWPNLRSFSSAPNFGVGATTDFNRMAISSCPFLLEVRMPHSLTNYRNIAILCQTKSNRSKDD